MNRDNIQYTINLLKQAQNFNIQTFQSCTSRLATSVEELHTCGNTACIAGYVALSPRWKELGGKQNNSGSPCPPDDYIDDDELHAAHYDPVVAGMAKFWGVNADTADAIVFGVDYESLAAHLGLDPEGWDDLDPAGAVRLFEELLIKGEPAWA